jgi:LysM repeat protein
MQKALKRTLLPLLTLALLLAAPLAVQARPGLSLEFNTLPLSGEPDTGDQAQIVAQETEALILPVATVTPNADGIIIHVVQYGETLWAISQAYGVPSATILANSNLSQETTGVYEGQTLIIQKATVPTATSTPTPTEDPGTPTPTQPRATMTPYPTRTPAPTQTPTRAPSIVLRALGDSKGLGIGLIAISVVGLGLLVYFGFLKKS